MTTRWYQGYDGQEYAEEVDAPEQPAQQFIDIQDHTSGILQEVRRAVQYERIGCLDAPLAWESLEREIIALAQDIHTLRTHQCRWSDDDYCVICGADGRA